MPHPDRDRPAEVVPGEVHGARDAEPIALREGPEHVPGQDLLLDPEGAVAPPARGVGRKACRLEIGATAELRPVKDRLELQADARRYAHLLAGRSEERR